MENIGVGMAKEVKVPEYPLGRKLTCAMKQAQTYSWVFKSIVGQRNKKRRRVKNDGQHSHTRVHRPHIRIAYNKN